ncbi:MAG: Methyl-accepting chemotaxis protein McpQ [Candidatus Celerinatantimonas neptuna]|nr:MAG: Methyl-accepting chemotaxis protein McpQ [Candidatus Celerinatantimonas neptuna]
MGAVRQFLENRTIGSKLGASFGCVLFLTLVVALTGHYGLNLMNRQSIKVAKTYALNHSFNSARIARRDYLRTGDIKYQQILTEDITHITRQLNDIKGLYQQDSSIFDLLSMVQQELDSYKRILNQLSGLIAHHQQLVTHSQQLRRQLKGAYQAISDQANILLHQGRLPSSALAHSAELQLELSRLFFLVRNFQERTADAPSLEQLQQAMDQLHQKSDEMGQLPGLSAPESSAIQQLEQYRQLTHQFDQVLHQMDQSELMFVHVAKKLLVNVHLLVQKQAIERQQDSHHVSYVLTLISLLALIIGSGAAFVIRQLIVRPLAETVAAARRIANRDLSRAKVFHERRDEVGILQSAMGQMTQTLRDLLGDITKGVNEIASAATQLSAFATQNNQAMRQQHDETNQVATAMQQMELSVQEVAQSTEQAASSTREVEKVAHSGYDNVKVNVGSIRHQAEVIANSEQNMERLKDKSDNVGQILSVIKAVAEQTNLLALNAAIEAARAGEAGRGFAVVADEVGALAKRTHQSAEEIELLIGDLQTQANESLVAMQESRKNAQENAENADQVQGLFDQIVSKIDQIQGMNQQIAGTCEEQQGVSSEINKSVVVVYELSEQTAQAAEQTTLATDQLMKLGQALKEVTSSFKLK